MCGNYSREETIQGRKLYEEIRYPMEATGAAYGGEAHSAQRGVLPVYFPVDLFLPYIVVNPPERKLAKHTSVQWRKDVDGGCLQPPHSTCTPSLLPYTLVHCEPSILPLWSCNFGGILVMVAFHTNFGEKDISRAEYWAKRSENFYGYQGKRFCGYFCQIWGEGAIATLVPNNFYQSW